MNIPTHLDRIETSKMSHAELDAGVALVLGHTTRLTQTDCQEVAEIMVDGAWTRFSPTTSWTDFGAAVTKTEIVIGTHDNGDEDNPRFWYSAHCFLSGTSTESYDDIRVVAARSIVSLGKVLEWRTKKA